MIKQLEETNKETSRKVIIIDKFAPLPWRITKKSLKTALSESLFRLGLKSIDLYMIQSPASSVRGVETWAEVLAECVEEGLVKTVGVANYK